LFFSQRRTNWLKLFLSTLSSTLILTQFYFLWQAKWCHLHTWWLCNTARSDIHTTYIRRVGHDVFALLATCTRLCSWHVHWTLDKYRLLYGIFISYPLSALGHDISARANKHDSSYYSNQNSKFYYWIKF